MTALLTAVSEAMANAPKPHANTDSPLSLHPKNIADVEAVLLTSPNTVSAPAYKASVTALTKAGEAAAAMSECEREMRGTDPANRVAGPNGITFTIPEEHKQRAADAMGRSFSAAAGHFDRALAEIDTALGNIASRINAAIVSPRRNESSVAAVHVQIRQYVERLPDGKRMSFVLDAAKSMDREIISAIAEGGPFISGLSRDEFAIARQTFEEVLAPSESIQRAALGKLRAKVEQGSRSFLAHYAHIVPKTAPNSKAAKASESLKRLEGAGR